MTPAWPPGMRTLWKTTWRRIGIRKSHLPAWPLKNVNPQVSIGGTWELIIRGRLKLHGHEKEVRIPVKLTPKWKQSHRRGINDDPAQRF